ncbi:MAG: sporulation protein [Micromonosporaceae bacterium]|nr:sporulation protein [Micromonosporaceae bacterium]
MGTTTGPLDVIRTAVATMAEKVYIDPIRQDGLTVIPAASVGAGGGGGGGSGGPEGEAAGTGEGGGFGLKAKPAGAFIIKQGKVRWQPAVDVNRVILGAQVVAVTALLVARAVILHRARTAHQPLAMKGRRRRSR